MTPVVSRDLIIPGMGSLRNSEEIEKGTVLKWLEREDELPGFPLDVVSLEGDRGGTSFRVEPDTQDLQAGIGTGDGPRFRGCGDFHFLLSEHPKVETQAITLRAATSHEVASLVQDGRIRQVLSEFIAQFQDLPGQRREVEVGESLRFLDRWDWQTL
jgi:hypothetical protein